MKRHARKHTFFVQKKLNFYSSKEVNNEGAMLLAM